MTLHTTRFTTDYRETYQAIHGSPAKKVESPPAKLGGMVCSLCEKRSANGCYYPHPLDPSHLLCVDCNNAMYSSGNF